MAVLFDTELTSSIQQQLNSVEHSITILSAFIKSQTLEWLSKNIRDNNRVKVTIVSRWRPNDLILGASDLKAYEYAEDNGWLFAINNNMHYKIYIFDNTNLFIGSANLTQKGLHIGLFGNDEATVQIVPTSIDIARIEKYVKNCCYIDGYLYQEITRFINDQEKTTYISSLDWPKNISMELNYKVKHLWVNDFLFNSHSRLNERSCKYKIHDYNLLGITKEDELHNRDILLHGLKKTMFWQWLIAIINDSDNRFVRFGEITAKLHNALLDDPKPYRKDVKSLLGNLFDWIHYINPPELGIKKFRHTEALFLK